MDSFTGQWDIVSGPGLDGEEGPPHLRLRQHEDRYEGEFSLGATSGQLDGRPDGPQRLLCSFEGMGATDLVNGAALAELHAEGLRLTLRHHFGPDQVFECRRPATDG